MAEQEVSLGVELFQGVDFQMLGGEPIHIVHVVDFHWGKELVLVGGAPVVAAPSVGVLHPLAGAHAVPPGADVHLRAEAATAVKTRG